MRSAYARWTPLSFLGKLDSRSDTAVDVLDFHTNGGGANLVPWFNQEYASTHQRIGCHFQFYKDGRVDQLADTSSIIYAEYSLSERCVSFETEDDGHPNDPWTPAQIQSMIKVAKELMGHHPIPRHLMSSPTDKGICYHQLFPTYNQLVHNCPGGVRVGQLNHVILPALAIVKPTPVPPKPGSHYPAPAHALPLPWMKYDVDTVTWQRRMLARGWHLIGTADGVFGKNCQAVCTSFQQQIRRQGFISPHPGQVDLVTWRASWLAPVT